MPTAQIRAGYRPIRIGFLTSESLEGVTAAAQLNTLVWGGIANPIFTVNDDLEAVSRAIRAFHLDVLHPVSDSQAISAVMEAHPHLAWPPGISPDPQPVFEPVGQNQEILPVDARFLSGQLWNSFYVQQEQSDWIDVQWRRDHDLRALFAVLFGEYGSTAPSPTCAQWFAEGLRASPIPVDDEVLPELTYRRTPIGLTGLGLEAPVSAHQGLDGHRLGQSWPG